MIDEIFLLMKEWLPWRVVSMRLADATGHIFDHEDVFWDLYENMFRLTKATSETITHYLTLSRHH
jgi:hypothetical protein